MIHFKHQKPISNDYDSRNKVHNEFKKKQLWWKSALSFFFKLRRTHHHSHEDKNDDVHLARARAFRSSISGPVYLTESRIGSTTPYRTTRGPSSSPIAGSLTPISKGEVDIPYLSLRELTIEQQLQEHKQRMSTTALPIYLVT
ncbi:hypothetical protein TanjilG_11436 [Lupinus angustifolius]|uniref:Uncharacterized protein n=1 Tax=Lupinus angustifolius TaxID=3871 RepID=A0A1J7IMV3_LUPAN|nr:PREDICTED: uncharacterized protein LOC109345209 [Lupinus angustifolius]OIW14091.1 hypothetical protein TanjilG_11436 [Lupinus angustifolius]